LAGARADARDDVFALGMTLFFALTGESPHGDIVREPLSDEERSGIHPQDLRRDVPLWLDSAIALATAVNPVDRFQTASRLAEVLASDGLAEVSAGVPDAGHCVVCGDFEPLGLMVCHHCASATEKSADTLIVQEGQERAAARVPASAGDRAVTRLRREGKRAIAVPVRLAWTAIPRESWLLALLVMIAGYAATGSTSITALWQPTVIAAIVLWSAQRTLRMPRRLALERGALPPTINDAMVGLVSELPRGSARSLHAGLSCAVRSYFALAERHQSLTLARESVSDLYLASCVITQDLAELDRLLDRSEREEIETISALARARECHVQSLLQATENVRRLCWLALDSNSDVTTAIGELGTDLARQRQAIAQTEALLRP
jgi:hypothetical protein